MELGYLIWIVKLKGIFSLQFLIQSDYNTPLKYCYNTFIKDYTHIGKKRERERRKKDRGEESDKDPRPLF